MTLGGGAVVERFADEEEEDCRSCMIPARAARGLAPETSADSGDAVSSGVGSC